jgi:hypothetical protein
MSATTHPMIGQACVFGGEESYSYGVPVADLSDGMLLVKVYGVETHKPLGFLKVEHLERYEELLVFPSMDAAVEYMGDSHARDNAASVAPRPRRPAPATR